MAAGVTKRSDGRMMKQFRIDGKKYCVYGKTAKECKEKELKKRAEIAAGVRKAADFTLDQYYEQWHEAKAGSVKETTQRSNEMMYKNIGRVSVGGHVLGSMKLQEIEAKHVKILQTELKKAGKSTRTINDTVSMLSSILESAVNERLLQWNPAKAIKPLRRTEERATENIHRALTREETALFLKTAEEMESWYLNLYRFLLHTGCRIGEAGAITAWDIRDREVQIRRTITRTETGAYVIGDDTKTEAGRRMIPLDDISEKAVKDQQEINTSRGNDAIEEPIFRTVRGTLLKSSIVNSDIARICKKAGIERFGVHAFRDTFATRCAESGMEVKQLQSTMGHTNVAMTLGLYTHSDEQRKAEQLKAVNFT